MSKYKNKESNTVKKDNSREKLKPVALSTSLFMSALMAVGTLAYYWGGNYAQWTPINLPHIGAERSVTGAIGATAVTQATAVSLNQPLVLMSSLPSIYTEASRQFLLPVRLRKDEQWAYDPERENEPVAIVDKVLMVPKTIAKYDSNHGQKTVG